MKSAGRTIGLSEKQYQIPASLARNCRFFLIEYPGPRPGAFAASRERRAISPTESVSIAVGLCEAAGVEASLGERALALDEILFGLRAAEDSAVLGRFHLLTLAFLQLSRSTQIDDLSQRTDLGYFLRKASIDTTFVSPAGSAGFSGLRADFEEEAG